MDLFIDDLEIVARGLPKTAATTARLSDNPDAWAGEVLQKAHQQKPFLGQFDVTVDLSEIDRENRTGLGQLIIKPRTVRPMEGQEARDNKGITGHMRSIRIPVIIANGELSSMDVFVQNKEVLPLTERRVSRALFRPTMTDIISSGEPEPWLSGSIAPPTRGGGRWGAMSLGHGIMGKLGGVKLSTALLTTIDSSQLQDWERQMSEDESLKHAALDNPAVLEFMSAVSEIKTMPVKTADALAAIPPTAIQFFYDDDRDAYVLRKTARSAYQREEQLLDRGQALDLVGSEIVKAADLQGPQTLSSETATERWPEENMAPVIKSGLHKVKTTGGVVLVGQVYANVFDLDGTPNSMKIFVSGDGKHGSVQSEIWGEPVAMVSDGEASKGAGSSDTADGFGIFVDDGFRRDCRAYGPVTIKGKTLTPDGLVLKAELMGTGDIVDIVLTRHVREATKTLEGRFLFPRYSDWVAIGDLVPLAENPMEATKVAGVEEAYREVTVQTDGDTFSFWGGVLSKLAMDDRTDLNRQQAELLAAVLGHEQDSFRAKVAEAVKMGTHLTLRGCLPITPAEEVVKRAAEIAESAWATTDGLQKDLLKQAAFIPDSDSVDSMLALKFLTPFNVSIFVGYIDTLDHAVKRLSELLIASRVGAKDIPEDAVVSAIKGIEDTIEGLERLKYDVAE